MSDKSQELLLLFDRPKEPVFFVKGDQEAVFDVPNEFLSDRFKPIATQLMNRFGEQAKERVHVNKIRIPDLGFALELSRFENFSLFINKHRTIAARLIEIFMGVRNAEDLKSVAVFARDKLNPYLFNYALSVALLHRPDTSHLDVPSFMTSFPDKFVDGTVLQQLQEEAHIVDEGSRMPIEIPRDYTASDAEVEHRLAYWREDLGINLHHWHWHLVYPFAGPDNVVRKNRRGELFYYMHQQIVARYNFERLSNKMPRVERLINLRSPIAEAYFPKLDSLVSSRGWPGRTSNTSLSNLFREVDGIKNDIDDLERWRDRIYAAIHSGSVMSSTGETIPLTEQNGIDILGDIVEASTLSVNSNFYGNIHNMGHVFIALSHDPDGRHLETFAVMGDSATAMRDPVFYRWHGFIDDLFQEYKGTLPPYEAPQLNFQGVTVTSVGIQSSTPNTLSTFWQKSDMNLSRGMDFTPRGTVFARFTHLQHEPYAYNIQVDNATGQQVRGTCRIFLAPTNDERGLPWLLRDQRLMFIEMDKFTVNLQPGQNNITRRDTESSVTIPFERTFRDLDTNRPAGGDALEQFNFCGCGWPHHMLVPRGSPEGFACQLFVMISNFEDDRVENEALTGMCNDSASFCGLKDRLYPDRRSMGFPFDRPPSGGAGATIQEFLTPNMRVQDVTIRLNDGPAQVNPRNKKK